MRVPSANQVVLPQWPRPWALLVLLLLIVPASAAPPPAVPGSDAPRPEPPPSAAAPAAELLDESPEEALTRARHAYARGEHGAVVAITRALLYPDPRLAGDSEIAAHRLLALSYVRLHETRLAEQEFHTLLQLREDFTLDPLDPAQARQMLDRIRRRDREKLDRIVEQRRREEAERRRRELENQTPPPAPAPTPAPAPRLVLERTIEKHSRLVSLVPFGVGQFQNGERKKGIALLATESFFAAASVSLFASILIIWPDGRYRTDSDPSRDQTRLARGLQLSQVLTGAVFWAEVLYGLIDARVHFVPQVVRERKLPEPTHGVLVPRRPTVAPLVLSGGGGLAIGGVF